MEALERISHSLIWGAVVVGLFFVLKGCQSQTFEKKLECMKMNKTSDECDRIFHN